MACDDDHFFLALVIDPPPPPEPEALWLRAMDGLSGPSPALRTITWIAIATALYQFEAVAKKHFADSHG